MERAFRAVLALALGIGAWSACYAGWLMASGAAAGTKDVALAAVGAGLLAAFRKRRTVKDRPGEAAPRWLWLLFAVSCAAAAAAFVEHTVRFPDGGWDAWMIWNLRARFLVRAADFRTAFSPDLAFLAHQDYPWLVPGAVAQAFAAFGESRALPALAAAIFGALAVAIVALAAARRFGARWGLFAGLAVTSLPSFPLFASNQQSDVPLSVYLASRPR